MASILVVDDHADLREILVRMLEMHSHSVTACSSGEAALASLATRLPDLIVVDERMAGMSGLEVVRHLRGQPRYNPLFIVVWSADAAFQPQALASGANDFWIKGSDTMLDSIDNLQQTLTAWKSRHGAA